MYVHVLRGGGREDPPYPIVRRAGLGYAAKATFTHPEIQKIFL